MHIRSKLIMTAILSATLVLTACAGSDEPAAVDTDEETTDDTVGEDADQTPMDEDMDEDMDGAMDEDMESGEVSIGEAADASEASRTIAVEAFDMAFDPETISVEPGEVVTFEVTNTGQAVHEFFLGDSAMQQEHAEEMTEVDEMPHDEPYSIRLEPDETKELTWRFDDGGEVEFACHEPGHYEAGMFGQITVG